MSLRKSLFLLMVTAFSLFAGSINISSVLLVIPSTNISGTVFIDSDRDGVYDSDEDTLSDIHIRLFKDVNNDGYICPHVGDTLVAETDTDENGNYQFTNVEDGDYLVQIMVNDPDIPSGSRLLTKNPIDITISGNSVDEVNFAFTESNIPQGNTHDYGDAPSSYPGDDGNNDDARHRVVDGVHLGFFIDADGDKDAGNDINSDDALADDNTSQDDEDGVQLLDPLIPGKTARVRVLASVDSNYETTLKGHFDLDGNNKWYNEGDEILISDSDVKNGVNIYTIDIPTSATNGDDNKSFVRFKYYDNRGSIGTCCWGEADSGEVEDYEINIGASYTITGTLFQDSNKNGKQDSDESGIANIKVGLYKDFDRDGIIDESDIVQEINTTNDGYYIFTVPPNLKISRGDYLVIVDTNDSDIPNNLELSGANPKEATMNNSNLTGIDFPFVEKPEPNINIEKSTNGEDADTIDSAVQLTEGDSVTWSYTVTNIGNIALKDISVSDDKEGAVECPKTTLDINESMTCTDKTGTASEGNYTNIALVQATADCSDSECEDINDTDPSNYQAEAKVLASIGDLVWLDSNANGIQDSGEVGISDITAVLYESDCSTEINSTKTDKDGKYIFDNLEAGNYCIGFKDIPSQYTISPKNQDRDSSKDSDIDPDTAKATSTTLDEGEADMSWDMGIYQSSSIGDKVWLDKNANGIQDVGEEGVSGVNIKLLQDCSTEINSTKTDEDGNYIFKDINPDDYCLEFELPTGYILSSKDIGSDDNRDSDVDSSTLRTETTNIISGEADMSWDMGIYKNATIGDKVWIDENGNGVQDSNESGQSGITVELMKDCNTSIATKTTDIDGKYLFEDITPAKYCLKFSNLPDGFITTTKNAGDDNIDSDINSDTLKSDLTELSSGENDTSWDMGIYKLASIGNRVWLDTNANGVQDENETGIANIEITLLKNCSTNIGTTDTDRDGIYFFNNLKPDTYCLKFSIPTGAYITYQDKGNDNNDSDVNPQTAKTVSTSLVSGENDTSWDMGIYYSSKIGDKVWYDDNKNGLQDSNENGVENIKVILYSEGCDNEVDNTKTDENGTYLFDNLTPGKYCIEFKDLPSNYTITSQNIGNNDSNDSDTNPSTAKIENIIIDSGQEDKTQDMGIKRDEASTSSTVTNYGSSSGVTTTPTTQHEPREQESRTQREDIQETPSTPIEEEENTESTEDTTPNIFRINDDEIEANTQGATTTIHVLSNDDEEAKNLTIRLVNIDGGEITLNDNGTAIGGTNISTTDMLVVPGEGIWRVEGDTITFTAENGFSGTPTPISYLVEDQQGNRSNIAEVTIKTDCNCKPYESSSSDSVATNNPFGIVVLIFITSMISLLFFREENKLN